MTATWGAYRRALGQALGWSLYTSESTAASAASAGTLLIPELIDTNLEPNYLDTTWEYQPTGTNAGEVRRVLKGGLAPATGTVTLSRAHTAATSSATAIEFYGVLPPTRALGRRGLLDAANSALSECWFIDTIDVTGDATLYQYPLTTWPWLQTADQVIDVMVRYSGAVRDVYLSQWRFIPDMDTPQLEVRSLLSGADTMKLVVYRPLDTWIAVGSTWADSTTGLVNDTDQALLPLNGMVQVGLYYCYQFLATEGDVSQRAVWQNMADRQRIRANKWKGGVLPTLNGRDVHWRAMARGEVAAIGANGAFDAGKMDV